MCSLRYRLAVEQPLVLLMEPDEGTRLQIAEAVERVRFSCLAVGEPSAAARGALLRPQIVAVSLLGSAPDGARLLLRGWHDEDGRAAIPILAVVPAGDPTAAERALADGADEVLPWPAGERLVAARLRSLASQSLLREENADFGRVLASVVRGLEAREGHRVDHSLRVSGLSLELGRQAGLPTAELDRLRQAGLFYDLGTVTIPDRILWKQGPLTDEETALVRSHPVVGHEMVRGLPSLEPARPFLLKHHERIDGSGYPYGLRGREIPVSVQVLGLSDAYEALVSSRPYRAHRSHAEAMTILSDEAVRGRWDGSLIALLESALPAAGLHHPAAAV